MLHPVTVLPKCLLLCCSLFSSFQTYTYSIPTPNQYFTTKDNMLVLAASLDYEAESIISFEIKAEGSTEGGRPVDLSTKLTVWCTICNYARNVFNAKANAFTVFLINHAN